MAISIKWLRLSAALIVSGQLAVTAQGLQRHANGFIVEYADNAVETSTDIEQDVVSQVSQELDLEVAHVMVMRSSIFNGASFGIVSSSQVAEDESGASAAREAAMVSDQKLEDTLMQMPSVVAVYPNYKRYLQSPVAFEGLPEEVAGQQPARRETGAVLERQSDSPGSSAWIYPGDSTPLVNPHSMTGVDRLQSEGITGQGITIAIIDSGVDAAHPALGGGYGPGFKIKGGYDFVGDAPDNVVDPPSPDDSPLTVCSNHGTATTSIAAALPWKHGFVGVAPNATLLHYKVFPCDGGVGTDVGVNASLTAYEAGADVINASIGSQGGWGNDLWGIIAARIMANGTVYTIAAGNDGTQGPFFANGLSSTIGVPSIGSVDTPYTSTLLANASYTVNDAEPVSFMYAPGFPANWSLGIEAIHLAVNGCVPFPNETYSNNSVIILPRPPPGTTTQDCDQNARTKDAGIRNILYYNSADNNPTRPLPLATTEEFPFDRLDGVGYVDNFVGQEIIQNIKQGDKVVFDLPWKPKLGDDDRIPRLMQNTISGGSMSNYSTWGPTYEAKIGTTFSAPGGFYLAAGGTIYGGFVFASGTSFSSPYAAGSAALIKQAHPSAKAVDIINRLASTSKPLRYQTTQRAQQDFLAPAFQQGAGLLDVWSAVHTNTVFNISDLAFNDTNFLTPISFEITNEATDAITYEISHSPATTVYTFAPGENLVTHFGNDTVFNSNLLPEVHADISFTNAENLTLVGGATRVITVTAKPPTGLEASRVPLYSGFITIKSSDGFNHSLPYGGIAANLRDVPVLDVTPGQERSFLIANSTDGNVRPGLDGNNLTSTFTVPRLPSSSNLTDSLGELTNVTLPGYQFSPLFGSQKANVSLLQDGQNLGGLSGDSVVSDSYFLREQNYSGLFYGRMADGRDVDSGTYRFQVLLLRVTGDQNTEADWDEIVTEPFTINIV